MKKLFLGVCLSVTLLTGCAALQGRSDAFLGSRAFQTAVDDGCLQACETQVAVDEGLCKNVCSTLADIGVEYAEGKGLSGLNDAQKVKVFEETFVYAANRVCGSVCDVQSGADPQVCNLACNFLAKTGIEMLKTKLE